jgi:VWFA-related protein
MSRHRYAGQLALVVLVVGGIAAIDAQRFTSRTLSVRVDVLVTNGRQPVTGLTARDFELRDNGVPQVLAQVDVEQLPLNLILVFDTSASVAGPRMHSLLEAGRALLDQLREADRVALVSFSTRVRLLAPLTPSRQQIRAAFSTLNPTGSTSLRDAAFSALALRPADSNRMLLLIFSDGADTSSWMSEDNVLAAARRTDTVVYAVGVTRRETRAHAFAMPPSAFDHGIQTMRGTVVVQDAGKFLEDLAGETGGRVLFADSNADLRGAFTRTLAEFRDRYVLSYTPTGVAATGWHRLDVTLKGRRGTVAARRGYFAE